MADFRPWYLILKAGAVEPAWTSACAAARGEVVAAVASDEVEVLEPGTIHTALFVVRFAFAGDLDAAWTTIAGTFPAGGQALAAPGLPYEGWPGHAVPTIATVDVPAGTTPRAYMLVEGTGTDERRMNAYRDIILPMIRQRGGYYTLFELGGSVRVLAGHWAEAILAISRWPTMAAARDFWFSERYQTVAIPIRTGVGHFEVQLAQGIAG